MYSIRLVGTGIMFKGSGAAVQKACGRSRALKRVQELQAAFKVQMHTESICFISHRKHGKYRNVYSHADWVDMLGLLRREILQI